ncbi:MAG: hypothetical protein Q7T33_06555 [Dehalococcoidia bacterium]|nr:hypothetical protein [Dehalococcoidia bacterium]
MTTPPDNPVDRRFNAARNRHLMAFYTVRKAHDRHRDLVNNAIEANRQGARDWSALGRRWLQQPTDIAGLLRDAAEATANARARSAALFQEWLQGVRDLRP